MISVSEHLTDADGTECCLTEYQFFLEVLTILH